ncbi:hypothetical protein GEMRC1_008233 [Eukaryota sp. GEM-RC1]
MNDLDYEEFPEDEQSLAEPILTKATKQKQYLTTDIPADYSPDLVISRVLSSYHPVISVVGPLHSGKTSLLDLFAQSNLPSFFSNSTLPTGLYWTDRRTDEHQRQMSIKSQPLTLLSSDHSFSLIDTPGHSQLVEEVECSLLLSDAVLFVLDVAEGVTQHSLSLLKICLEQHKSILLFLNKFDRLIMDLRIPPVDCFFKIKHILGQLNEFSANFLDDTYHFDPRKNNVVFGSSFYGFQFDLSFFSRMYSTPEVELNNSNFWGNIYYHPNEQVFSNQSQGQNQTFVEFILDPIYKLFIQTLTLEPKQLRSFLRVFPFKRVKISADESKLNSKELVYTVLNRFFSTNDAPFAESLTVKLFDCFSSVIGDLVYQSNVIKNLNLQIESHLLKEETIVVFSKIIPNPDGLSFSYLGRVINGQLTVNQTLTFKEQSSVHHDSELKTARVCSIGIHQSRFDFELPYASSGSLVTFQLDNNNILSQSIGVAVGMELSEVFGAISLNVVKFSFPPVIKLPIEPVLSSELPNLASCLLIVQKYYPNLKISVAESGEYSLSAPGELYLDSVLKDVSEFFGKFQLKVVDPLVELKETIIQESQIDCTSKSLNNQNKLTLAAFPVNNDSARIIQHSEGLINDVTKGQLSNIGWDDLSLANLWSFAPSLLPSNALVDESMVAESGDYSPVPNDVDQSIKKDLIGLFGKVH